jgi:negative regulator of flagellin synthesis FlgM
MNSLERFSSDATRLYLKPVDGVRPAAQSTNQTAQTQQTRPTVESTSDSVTLSQGARTLAQARATVAQAPDVREDRVADIRHQIATGTYQVSAHVLARKMLGDANLT